MTSHSGGECNDVVVVLTVFFPEQRRIKVKRAKIFSWILVVYGVKGSRFPSTAVRRSGLHYDDNRRRDEGWNGEAKQEATNVRR